MPGNRADKVAKLVFHPGLDRNPRVTFVTDYNAFSPLIVSLPPTDAGSAARSIPGKVT